MIYSRMIIVDPRLREDDMKLMKIFPLVEGQLRQSSEVHSRTESGARGSCILHSSFSCKDIILIYNL